LAGVQGAVTSVPVGLPEISGEKGKIDLSKTGKDNNDEIAGRITPERRALMGQLLNQLARHHGDGTEIEGVRCPVCGEAMTGKGKSKRSEAQAEGKMNLEQALSHLGGERADPVW